MPPTLQWSPTEKQSITHVSLVSNQTLCSEFYEQTFLSQMHDWVSSLQVLWTPVAQTNAVPPWGRERGFPGISAFCWTSAPRGTTCYTKFTNHRELQTSGLGGNSIWHLWGFLFLFLFFNLSGCLFQLFSYFFNYFCSYFYIYIIYILILISIHCILFYFNFIFVYIYI